MICLKSKAIRFSILKKSEKKGKTENFVYTIGKRCLSFDIVTISDVTTGQLQNVWTPVQIWFIVIFGTYFFQLYDDIKWLLKGATLSSLSARPVL